MLNLNGFKEFDNLEKGKSLPEGTIQTWKDGEYIKKNGKWVSYKESVKSVLDKNRKINKTEEEIKAEKLSQELTKRGIVNHFSISSTDYGTSCYFTFYKNKDNTDKYIIRISDHSVSNPSRISNERHEKSSTINIKRVADSVELYLFPERFVFVPKKEGFTHRVNGVFGIYEKLENKINNNS